MLKEDSYQWFVIKYAKILKNKQVEKREVVSANNIPRKLKTVNANF
jgi:hypothetical protein